MRVPGLSVAEVDRMSDEFVALVEREMQTAANLAARQLGDRLAARGNLASVSQGDVNIIFRLWGAAIDDRLLSALEDIWLRGANHQSKAVADVLPLLAAVQMPDASTDPGATAPPPPPQSPSIFVKGSEAALSFLSTAKNQLRNIGNELWSSARISLTAGMVAGESIPKLARRVREATGVARARATMIARTEVIGASNAGSIYSMRSTDGLVTRKSWLATFDGRTRDDHIRAHGQTVDLGDKFRVGGAKMDHPGDPTGPAEQVINCRCSMTYEVEMPPLDDPLLAAVVSETTGMIALRPTEPDAFVVDGGDPADELHVTVAFLGDQADQARDAAAVVAKEVADSAEPFTVRVAGYGALGDDGAVVLFLNGEGLTEIHDGVAAGVAGMIEDGLVPVPYSPWICHMTLGYGIDVALGQQFVGREFIIDALTVDVGGESDRFVLGDGAVTVRASIDGEATVTEVFQDEDGRRARWRGVMVVEDTPTGDGRQFAADALTWPEMPLPLQWQKETSHGGFNDVTVTVGTIDEITRDGNQLIGEGLIDLGSEDGREVFRRIDELGLGGVSIVADDPENADVEYVYPEGCAELDDLTPDEIEAEVPLEDLARCFEPELVIFHSGRIRALTVVDTPAFVEAKIEIIDEVEVTAAVATLPVGLTINGQSYEIGEIASTEQIADLLREAAEHLASGDWEVFTPVASHETATSDDPWDASENEGRLPSPMTASVGERFYAWIDRDAVEDGEMPKTAGKFPHHNVSTDGAPGAANLAGARAGIGVLNGARGGADIPEADRQGIYNHLARHIRDAGEDPPELRDADDLVEAEADVPEQLVAAAYTVTIPDLPPLEWYTEPKELPDIGAIKVTPEGRFYGLLAPSGIAHRGKAQRTEVPMRNVDYSRFMSRPTPVAMADNTVEEIPAGVVTMNCGHAKAIPSVSAEAAMEHYDNSCSLAATVRIGENSKGVWVAGALMPGIEATDLARLLGCQLSGDWRPHQEQPGMRELTAALLVPVPGFASAGPTVRLDQGELVAATAPVHFEATDDVGIKTFTTDEVVTETVIETTTEIEVDIDEPDAPAADDEPATEDAAGDLLAADIHDGIVEDLPDFEEALRVNDPKTLAAEMAAELGLDQKTKLAELVASVKGSE